MRRSSGAALALGTALIVSALLAAALLGSAAPVAAAGSPPGSSGSSGALTLTLTRALGWVGAQMSAPAGAAVLLSESIDGQASPVANLTVPPSGSVTLAHAVPWLCTRRTRTLTLAQSGSSTAPAAATIVTPSCAGRLGLVLSRRRAPVGAKLTVRVEDAWGTGAVGFELCTVAPLSPPRCRPASLGAGQRSLSIAERLLSPGSWRIALRTPWGPPLERAVHVGPRGGVFSLLATGDSEIQEVDTDLSDTLMPFGVRVHSDARIGTGISKVAQLDWVRHAALQAARLRPDATVVFIGANDGFALRGPSGAEIPCCGAAWIHLFAERAAQMMDAYLRGGRGRVLWFTLPIARDSGHAQLFRAVNRAYLQAAAGFRGGVELIRADQIFTPGGRYRQTMAYHGHVLDVRAPDGIHLSPAGARIAASAVLAAMRHGRLLG